VRLSRIASRIVRAIMDPPRRKTMPCPIGVQYMWVYVKIQPYSQVACFIDFVELFATPVYVH
jgi:hypothetical protein